MILPSIMFRRLVESNTEHKDSLRGQILGIEGILNYIQEQKDGEKDDTKLHIFSKEKLYDEVYYRYLSRQLNMCKKQQASRDRRHEFWRQFRKVIFDALNELENTFVVGEEELSSEGNTQTRTERDSIAAAAFTKGNLELTQWTSGNGRIFEFLQGRDVNYRARIENHLNTVSFIGWHSLQST